MTGKNTGSFKVGDAVKILNSRYQGGKIVEDRGLLGPHGSRIYRVCVRRKPNAAYVELREDQLEPIDANGSQS